MLHHERLAAVFSCYAPATAPAAGGAATAAGPPPPPPLLLPQATAPQASAPQSITLLTPQRQAAATAPPPSTAKAPPPRPPSPQPSPPPPPPSPPHLPPANMQQPTPPAINMLPPLPSTTPPLPLADMRQAAAIPLPGAGIPTTPAVTLPRPRLQLRQQRHPFRRSYCRQFPIFHRLPQNSVQHPRPAMHPCFPLQQLGRRGLPKLCQHQSWSHAALTCASSLEFPAKRMVPAALVASTGCLSRWLKVHLFVYTQHQVSLLEEPVIAQSGRPARPCSRPNSSKRSPISIHCRDSFKKKFWPFQECQNEKTE